MKCVLLLALAFACGGSQARRPPPESAQTANLKKQCDGGSAPACARLMHELVSTPDVADQYGLRACTLGDQTACEFVGNILFVRALAPKASEDAKALFTESRRPFSRACDLGSWFGCVRVAAALQRTGGSRVDQRAYAKKGFSLAEIACDKGEPAACDYLAVWAASAGDLERQKQAVARACRALLEQATSEARKQLIEVSDTCKDARRLGVAPPDLTSMKSRTVSKPVVPASMLEAKRIFGEIDLVPTDGVKLAMKEHHLQRLMARIKICVSEYGRVANLNVELSTGAPAYDRLIFEKLREWRYTASTVDGKPMPVCTDVILTYTQR